MCGLRPTTCATAAGAAPVPWGPRASRRVAPLRHRAPGIRAPRHPVLPRGFAVAEKRNNVEENAKARKSLCAKARRKRKRETDKIQLTIVPGATLLTLPAFALSLPSRFRAEKS